jgi:uncharacterized protein (DUF58 family)
VIAALRTALSALTTRGRAFVSSGATAVVCSFLLGLDDLARVGALLVVLPLLSAVVTTRGRHRLGLSRTVEPPQVTVGQVAHVDLHLSNQGRAPTGLLLVEEQVPYALGVRPRFVIDRMGPNWHRSVRYAVRSELRGRYTLGPMTVRVNDPFGLVAFVRSFQSSASLVVTPEVVALPTIPLSGTYSGTGEHRPRSFAGGSAEDVTTREYRHGDDLRRVHWRSSAHAGELMVRREEQPWESRATLYVENRRHLHRGTGTASSLESAVTIAASVASHLLQRGFEVHLVSSAGPLVHHGRESRADRAALLEALAVLQVSPRTHLGTEALSAMAHGGLVVGVLGDLQDADLEVLGRVKRPAEPPLAIVLDTPLWDPEGGGSAATNPAVVRRASSPGSSDPADGLARGARLLSGRGWRTVSAGPRDSVPRLWQELAVARRRGAAFGPAADPARRPERSAS